MEWITLAEAGRELGISPQRVGQLAKAKELRSKRHRPRGFRITMIYVSRKDVLARKANMPRSGRPRLVQDPD